MSVPCSIDIWRMRSSFVCFFAPLGLCAVGGDGGGRVDREKGREGEERASAFLSPP